MTDVTGVSARAMLEALVAGSTDVSALAEMAKGRLRAKRSELEQALAGTLQSHHAFMIAQHLSHLDFLEEQIAAFDQAVETSISVGAAQRARRADVGGRREQQARRSGRRGRQHKLAGCSHAL